MASNKFNVYNKNFNNPTEMKKILSLFVAALLLATSAFAEETAELTFQKKTHNFGVVAQDTCIVTCTFTFTNTGNAPLIIHQAISSCGCTVPQYTQEPIAPGKQGTMLVTYNGKAKRPGVFKKSITIHSNAANTPVRIYIEGEMIALDNIEELVPITTDDQIQEADTVEVKPQPAVKSGKRFRLFPRRKKTGETK